jgi:hypothetical protein
MSLTKLTVNGEEVKEVRRKHKEVENLVLDWQEEERCS